MQEIYSNLDKNRIISVHERILKYVHNSPLLTSRTLNKLTNSNLYFKCENFQKAGAFKFRGATNAVLSLSKDEISRGIATHSSGNHAGALSLAGKLRGAKAFIVMPKNAPKIKIEAVKEYGAEIIFCEPNLKSREETLRKVVSKTGAVFIHPYNDFRIICGQATCAKEVFEKIEELDYIVAPVGGGGLLSGTCLSAKYFSSNTLIIGAEPSGADDAFRSIRDGKIYPSVNPKTIADGLLTSLGELTFNILYDHVSEIITVDDMIIIEAMRMIWERMKIIIEPSAAVPFAVVLNNLNKFYGKKVCIILSGGNVDFENLPWSQNKI
ncbi:pyridoxal-phosphate dependent enzyme [Bacteroidota bacterium]